jgi:hypothetical protein
MHRRLALLALALVGGAGCRSEAVTLGFEPAEGARYAFAYEIVGTVTTTVEGEAPERVELRTSLRSTQEVVGATPDGVVVAVELRSEGGAPRTAEVVLDRAGSLRSIERIEGLPVDTFALPAAGSLVASEAAAPPDGPLVLGDRWTIGEAGLTGEARLARLGVLDGSAAAQVTATLTEAIDRVDEVGDSDVRLAGTLRSTTSTDYDLVDGSIRRATTTTAGRVEATIAPPEGITAEPVQASIRYELEVVTRRLG